jgi:hypothetical protein
MGMHTIQQARIKYPSTFIIALASQRHHAMLKRLGAHAVFDYNSASVVQEVRELGRDIRRAIDCHSEGESTVLAAECMLPADGGDEEYEEGVGGMKNAKRRRRIVRTLPPGLMKGMVPDGVRADEWIVSYTALGKVCPHLSLSVSLSPSLSLRLSLSVSLSPSLSLRLSLSVSLSPSLSLRPSSPPFWSSISTHPPSTLLRLPSHSPPLSPPPLSTQITALFIYPNSKTPLPPANSLSTSSSNTTPPPPQLTRTPHATSRIRHACYKGTSYSSGVG